MLLCQSLTTDLFKVLVLTCGVVFGSQQTPHLHGTDQTGGTHPGQLLAGKGMALQICKPLFAPGSGFLRIVDRHSLAAGSGDGLQTLPAKHRAHTGTACSTFIGNDGGVFYQIFAGGPNTQPAEFLLTHKLAQLFLAFSRPGSPQVIGIVEEKLVLIDLQPLAALAFSLQNQSIIARLLQMEAEAAAAVRGRQDPSLGRKGRNIEPGRAGGAGACQRSGGNDDPVFFAERRFLAGQMVTQDPGGHDLAA